VPGGASRVDVNASPSSIPIDGVVNLFDISIVGRVSDCSNTAVDVGTLVTLETDLGIFRESGTRSLHMLSVDGLVTGTLTSESVAGLVTITGTVGVHVGTTTVRFLPGEPWSPEVRANPQSIYADGVSDCTVAARVMDAYENPVLEGITITFGTDYGHFEGSGSAIYTTTTDADGYAYAVLVSSREQHVVLVRAIIEVNSRQGYTNVFFVEPPTPTPTCTATSSPTPTATPTQRILRVYLPVVIKLSL
jgi:hypothetical protein